MKNQKGITLIALVITIIVMLILVGVSVTVALKGDLFGAAQKAARNTAEARNQEVLLSSGKVEIGGKIYNSIEEYVGTGVNVGGSTGTNPGTEENKLEEITIKGETFYIIADNGTTLTLLAKNILNEMGTAQASGWFGSYPIAPQGSLSSFVAGENLNNNSELKTNTDSAVYKAMQYGESLGGRGRLLLLEEVMALTNECKEVLYQGVNRSWWTGTAHDDNSVYFVTIIDGAWHNVIYWDDDAAIRPVVEIDKSSIQ